MAQDLFILKYPTADPQGEYVAFDIASGGYPYRVLTPDLAKIFHSRQEVDSYINTIRSNNFTIHWVGISVGPAI